MSHAPASELGARATEAALQLIEQEGIEALTLRAVARRLGVTHRAIAKQTDGLPGLLAAAAAAVYRRLDASLERLPACAPGRPGAFRAIGRAYIDFARVHPAWIRLLTLPAVAADQTPGLQEARRWFYARMRAAVEDGQRRGVLRTGPATPLATFAWTAVQGFAMLEHELVAVDDDGPDARAEAFLDGVFLGVRTLGPPTWWPESVRPA